jgi:hypothetical protein
MNIQKICHPGRSEAKTRDLAAKRSRITPLSRLSGMTKIIIFIPLLLAACESEQRLALAPIDFKAEAPIGLNVATVQVVDEYEPPKVLPHVEHAAPTPPYTAIREWANERLRPRVPDGYIRVGIRDASIVQKQLVGQIEYEGRLDVTLDAQSGDGLHSATSEITVERQVTVDDDKDLAEKEQIWNDMTRTMMEEFDRRATASISQNFGYFTSRSGNP